MIIYRKLLTLSLVLGAVGVTVAWALPSKRAADDAGETVAAAGEKDDYNPQCLPLEYFDKIQSEKEARAKRDEKAVAVPAEETKDGAEDEIVAQPGFFVPARRRRPCFGRGRNFTKDCGPGPRAYRVKNFVMAKPPASPPASPPPPPPVTPKPPRRKP